MFLRRPPNAWLAITQSYTVAQLSVFAVNGDAGPPYWSGWDKQKGLSYLTGSAYDTFCSARVSGEHISHAQLAHHL